VSEQGKNGIAVDDRILIKEGPGGETELGHGRKNAGYMQTLITRERGEGTKKVEGFLAVDVVFVFSLRSKKGE